VASQDQQAALDEELAQVSRLLKQAGCATVNGCQDVGRRLVLFRFLTAEDAMTFLDDMAAYAPEPHPADVPAAGPDNSFSEPLYARITGCGSPDDWAYGMEPEGWEPDETAEDPEQVEESHGLFPMAVSVCVPRADLPLIRERLAKAVQDPRRPAGPNGWCYYKIDSWHHDDVIWLHQVLCELAVGACQPRPEGRPNTAWVTFGSAMGAGEFLNLIDNISIRWDDPPGSGPAAFSIDPGRARTLDDPISGTCQDAGKNWSVKVRATGHVFEEYRVNGVVVRPRIGPQLSFEVTIGIPTADVPLIFERLQEVALDQDRV
jgi:hypothetical protein